MGYIRLDFSKDQVRGTDFRNYAIQNSSAPVRVSVRTSQDPVDCYPLKLPGNLVVTTNFDRSVVMKDGFIFGDEQASRELVESLGLTDLVVRGNER